MSASALRPVLCVDVGGTSTKVGVMQTSGEVQVHGTLRTKGPDPEKFAAELCQEIAKVNTAVGSSGTELAGIGVAIAGFLDDERRSMIYNSNIPWLMGFPLRDRIADRFHLPVELEVDSNAAAIAEQHYGSGRDSKRFLCVTVGTGLGVGMIIDGQPLRFAYGCLGDIGHLVLQPNGPVCTCGGRGCAEIYVSAPVLADKFRNAKRFSEETTLRDVIVAARAGDAIGRAVLQEAGEWLGLAIASMANTFYPDRIAIAGGLAEGGELVMDAVVAAFRNSVSDFAREKALLGRAKLGSLATLAGAGCLIMGRSRLAQA
jgi:glucokinase